ncbi:response regulator [Roseobacter litoralis]|uniref:Response regulator n=1 Tax=Roseobacter litoralis (strain ATCC 49566 / DSM 6996 / JCM 21268 / NBRC 15278 / OCh 149) TaxID=391595 RepID=F7ZIN5_ROSLO|nr:response regulator [Roseobacter litoralis]AEI93754.1 putative response regulator [Roseobacter litoralis Och 149]
MNILIVDDSEYDALELSTKLATILPAAVVTWRSSPDRALEKVACSDAKPYDIVFVDQHMPGRLGTDLVKKLGKMLNRKVTRVVMLTSDGGDTTRATALVSDCDGFLTKPVDMNRLRAFLDGSRCQWEMSDLPTNMEHYWKLLENRESKLNGSVR